jgi:hypothetical protein
MAVNSFHDSGGGERAADRFRVAEKGQVVRTLLAQLGDEAGVGFGETVTEFFKLLMSDFEIPRGF